MWENVLKRGKGYPCADHPTREECKGVAYKHLRAVWTGEHRCPRKGEWYLSGAVIEAYKAPNDLSTAFPIASLVRLETQQEVLIPL